MKLSRKKKSKTEFSKKLLMVSYAIGVLIILYAMFIQMLIITKDFHGDSGIVIALISGAFAEMGVVTGFYKIKALRENQIKLKQIYGYNIETDDQIEDDQGGYK